MSPAPEWFPPLAPLPERGGTTFRVVARRPESLLLQLYDHPGQAAPARTIELDARTHRQGEIWEAFVEGVGEGQLYTWAVDEDRPLLDPCALLVSGPTHFGSDDPDRPRPPLADLNRDARCKSVVVAPAPVTWTRPRTPWHESIVYELHVRGFTRQGGEGTYRALARKAEYLRDLGVTAVELLPVQEFDETEVRRGESLFNFWGYSPVGWFAPQRRYAATAAEVLGPLREFREMVQAFHAAGLQVILDVVFNHTAELGVTGPTWSLRGLDDDLYYLHELRTGDYVDLTGCGNTVRAQHPTVRGTILHALRWWVHGMGVDGFRFDLAAVLARDITGSIVAKPPLLREIEEDPWLRPAHLIAEAWDGGGGYLVDRWPAGPRWAVWNDRFRDDVRRAWLDKAPEAGRLATRLSGSSDLFAAHGPPRSLNYVTCHDGFTLLDAVSYARKHNDANAESNHDGHHAEVSANHGAEGPSDDAAVRAARDRARRNLVATLLLSQGVPMLLGGDELGRTQQGNNNAYCHDSALTWVDWDGLERDHDFYRFVKGIVQLRRDTPGLMRQAFLDEDDITWLAPGGGVVDWAHAAFAYRLDHLFVMVNLRDTAETFTLPPGHWRSVVNTAAEPPFDCVEHGLAIAGHTLALPARSLVVLAGAAP